MAFDIGAILKEMADAAGGVLSTEGAKAKGCVKKALEQEKEALEAIASARIAGEITAEDMETHVADEKDALRAALLACRVKGKMAAQKAANAAIKVFTDAVKAAL
jgi:hypothetical protein